MLYFYINYKIILKIAFFNMENQKIDVLIISATGKLGSLVTKNCLKQNNLQVHVIIRNPEKDQELVKEVQQAGGKVIVNDNKPETLKDCTKGIHTVISCIAAFGEDAIQTQYTVLEDANKNGVKRFFSSHFGVNYDHAPRDNMIFDNKIKFNESLAKTQIKPVVISCGLLLEFFLSFHSKEFHYWGDINQKIDLTTYEDVAKYVAALAAQPERSGDFNFVGEELSTKEIAEIYNRVRGTNVQPKNRGTIEEMKNKAKEIKGTGLESIFIDIYYLVYSGDGKIHSTNNKEFPEVKVTSLEEFLKSNPSFTLA